MADSDGRHRRQVVDILPRLKAVGFLDASARNPDITIAGITLALQFGNALPKYIPSLGQLNLMAHYMDELNKAFTYVSASPLSSTWYWSSTENSQAVAWYVVFSSGLTGTGNKHIGDMVRAVIDF